MERMGGSGAQPIVSFAGGLSADKSVWVDGVIQSDTRGLSFSVISRWLGFLIVTVSIKRISNPLMHGFVLQNQGEEFNKWLLHSHRKKQR